MVGVGAYLRVFCTKSHGGGLLEGVLHQETSHGGGCTKMGVATKA
jgi:hypothetical protein